MHNIIISNDSHVIKLHDCVNGFDCGFHKTCLNDFIAKLMELKDSGYSTSPDFNTKHFNIPTYYGNWVRIDRIDKIIQKLNMTFGTVTIDKLKGLTRNEIIKQIECLDIYYLNRLANGS